MHHEFLLQAGLSQQQIDVYIYLLTHGTSRASALTKALPYKKSLMYKILGDLTDLGLITKQECDGKVALFHPEHPLALRTLAEKREKEAQDAQIAIDSALGQLISTYNLATGKPGVEFHEGIEGVTKVLADSLTSTEEIYAYVDSKTLDEKDDFITAEAEYVKKRIGKNITKKILMVDSPEARAYAEQNASPHTKIRILSQSVPAFGAAMEIYDNRVSYVTFHNNVMTGTLIYSPPIYAMHRALFESTWDKSRSF